MSIWVYESHMGGLFTIPDQLSFDECYCEQCGDCDWEVGEFETMADFIKYSANDISVSPECSGYDIDYIIQSVGSAFEDKLTREQVREIVLEELENGDLLGEVGDV